MKYLYDYTFFINENASSFSYTITSGKVSPNAKDPNYKFNVSANSPDEFISKINNVLLKRDEPLMDIEVIRNIKSYLNKKGHLPKWKMDIKSKLFHYDGDFKFLVDMKKKLKKGEDFTDKQWDAIHRSFYGKYSRK